LAGDSKGQRQWRECRHRRGVLRISRGCRWERLESGIYVCILWHRCGVDILCEIGLRYVLMQRDLRGLEMCRWVPAYRPSTSLDWILSIPKVRVGVLHLLHGHIEGLLSASCQVPLAAVVHKSSPPRHHGLWTVASTARLYNSHSTWPLPARATRHAPYPVLQGQVSGEFVQRRIHNITHMVDVPYGSPHGRGHHL
jgi:hypothetical protein